MAIVLGEHSALFREIGVGSSGNWYPVANGVRTDDKATCVNTCVASGALKLAGVFDSVALHRVARLLCV